MSTEELIEKVICLRFASMDIQTASRYVVLAKGQPKNETKFPILEAAIIAYVRPFTRCEINNGKKQVLIENGMVPAKYAVLHEDLVSYRHGLVAHTDIHIRNPKLSRWSKSNEPPCFPMVFRGCYIEEWVKRADEMQAFFLMLRELILEEIKKCEDKLNSIDDNKDETA